MILHSFRARGSQRLVGKCLREYIFKVKMPTISTVGEYLVLHFPGIIFYPILMHIVRTLQGLACRFPNR